MLVSKLFKIKAFRTSQKIRLEVERKIVKEVLDLVTRRLSKTS